MGGDIMLPYLPGIILISLYAYYSIKISLFLNYGWCPTILVFQFCYVRDDILLNQWNAVQYSPSGMEFLRKSRNQWLIRNSVFEPWQAIIYLQQNWDSWVPRVVDKTLSNLDAVKKRKCWKCLAISSGFQYDFLRYVSEKGRLNQF